MGRPNTTLIVCEEGLEDNLEPKYGPPTIEVAVPAGLSWIQQLCKLDPELLALVLQLLVGHRC